MKYTQYFLAMKQRPDRAIIRIEWIEIEYVIANPVKEQIQSDGRIRLWAAISEMNSKYLRVILLPDRETVNNAFFDHAKHGAARSLF